MYSILRFSCSCDPTMCNYIGYYQLHKRQVKYKLRKFIKIYNNRENALHALLTKKDLTQFF